MKTSSVILPFILALCATINGKAIDNDQIEKLKPIKPITEPIIPCPLNIGTIVTKIRKCQALDGKFYHKFNTYPKCRMDYVCFIPAAKNENTKRKTCIAIDEKLYCSADISNIESCQLKNENYYFRQCVKEADELFTNFEYTFISGRTIMPPRPPQTSTRTVVTLDPTIIKPTKTKITLDPTIIRPTKTKITLDPTIIRPTRTIIKPTIISITDSIKFPIKTDIIVDPIPTIEPYHPTAIPVPIVRPTTVPEVKKGETE